MAIGDNASAAVRSYIAIGREAAWGTFISTTASLIPVESLSCNFKTNIKSMKIPSLSTNRGQARRVMLEKEVLGTLESYAHPVESALTFIAALGGSITTTSLTAAWSHVIMAGNFDQSVSSVCFGVRKGDSQAWRYQGGRVNSLKLSCNVGEPLKVSADFIFKDSTQLSEDLSGLLSASAYMPFTFANGTFAYSGVSEKITGFELTINNNLKSDKDARALGQNTLQVLPATNREIEFKISQRIDTTTVWSRFISATNAAVVLSFSGDAITTEHNNGLTIDLAKVFYQTPDVELKGPGDILISEIPFDVVVDNPHTTTGYDIKFTIKNDVASY